MRVAQINLQAQVDGKVSADEVDPAIGALNAQLGVTRKEIDKAATAAADSWAPLNAGANEALDALRRSVDEAAGQIERDLQD